MNVGYGSDVTISDLANEVAKTLGYAGKIELDASKPDGAPRKLMDSNRLRNPGWIPEITVQQMCQEMVQGDLKESKRHALLKANGYVVNVRFE